MKTQRIDLMTAALSVPAPGGGHGVTALPSSRVLPRRGLTLTEILAATFVLSIGLMAALTVLPFSAFQLNRMNVADTSGACGRGAIQQIRMAEWYKPDALDYNWGGSVPADPFIVDPLGIALGPKRNSAINDLQPFQKYLFPYYSPGQRVDPDDYDFGLCAFNLTEIAGRGADAVEAAYQHFCWNDDTVFVSDDSSVRPTLVTITHSDGTTELVKQGAGDFTWLYMVTPIIDTHTQTPIGRDSQNFGTTSPNYVAGYEVAAVVFHRRIMALDKDDPYQPIRRVGTTMPSINVTGAYIELTSANLDELDLSTIKWLLLTSDPSDRSSKPFTARWYRITGYDDIIPVGRGYMRRVFLVGPDWDGPKDNNGNLRTVYAILCDGVVNVFQATMPK